ncbi:P-loop containing nucleoside triphosphate hydrolase protein [Dactylonectria estremocensis]|uniref:P-loop containing nucleoside triphosphate hydrolase protein n=1 Tax=Dactylonectria estremocensis TaxID=1079267 RepID=A0A9P9JCQ7_9HYPO|nr:P-loop containing nucleoside triphosphate hydrolase protein [Dactylonectria estremocensis]
MGDPLEKELKVPDVQAATIQPTNLERPTDSDEDRIEKTGEKDGENTSQVKDIDDEEDEIKGSELKVTKTSASAATTATHATTQAPIPEKKPWHKKLNPLRWGPPPPVPTEKIVSREFKAGFFSLLTFQWMAPLMKNGYRRSLEENDIWTVNPNRAAGPLTAQLKDSFKRRVARGDKYPLLWAMHETFKFGIWLGGICALFTNIVQVISPFTLRYLIQFASDAWEAHMTGGPAPHIGRGIGLAIGITLMQVAQSLGTNHFIYQGMMVGGQFRGVLIGLIYEKSMLISGRAKAGMKPTMPPETESAEDKESSKGKQKQGKKGKSGSDAQDGSGWGNGRIVNLMSVDTYRIDQASALFHMTWTSPVLVLVTLALLLVNITYSALAGFGLLVVGMPFLTKAIRSLFHRRRDINKITDDRVSLTQEILQSVRFVKYFGWEKSFLERLSDYRSREIHAIQVLLAIRNALNAVSMSLPIFASMLSFIAYSLTNHGLAPAEIFSSLALFNGLRIPLNLLPLVLGQVVDAWSSLQRIEEFLLEEEMVEEMTIETEGEDAIRLGNASFTWEKTPTNEPEKPAAGKGKKSKKEKKEKKKKLVATPEIDPASEDTASTLVEEREPFKLHDLSMSVKRNELVAVIGSVGSGKSSLLSALAGDMRKTQGDVVFGSSRAFCPQYAWIQNTTLQKNITFGKELDKSWYKEVVRACALQADLDMLPNGDQTEIGERGITISGGQKQRLNIARAIYFDADIVLMDDPLSAVDAHVGRHIFDKAILGLLKDKCRILATHQLWVLNRCDRIVWMEGGKIQAIDTFDNLMREHRGFQALMETTAVEDREEDASKPDEAKADIDGKDKKKKKKSGALMQQEERATASVPWSVYTAYIGASGSILNAPLVIFVLLLSQGANIMTSLWLSYWTSDKYNLATGVYIGIYAALGVAQAVLMFIFSVLLSILGTNSSKYMLQQAVKRVLRAPMAFFDTTPLGRITNRFSRDVDVMDNNLTDAIRMFFLTMAMITSVFILIIAYFYYFAIALVPLYVLFVLAASYYRASAREVKRYESVLRSHVFAKFGEGLSGVASIRAYGLQDRFIEDLRASIDEMNSAYYITFANQRWLSVRIDIIGVLLVFTVAILVVTSRFTINPSIGGLVLSYILSIVGMMQFSVRQLAEVENAMNAVERLYYYGTEIEEEAPEHTIEVRKSWPEKGEIIFENVEMRYRANLPLVLQGLSMHVQGGERIGIVGRTGAGKSSIMSTLFRLVEISGGRITIDGLDISTIGLHDLRSRLAIIPQDPTLFRGTVRSNLDPFHEHTDLALWSALRQADLIPVEAGDSPAEARRQDPSRIHLDSVVEEDGLNFSLGQRQLMALARALVRGSQIIVCDEATSSVDMETDDKIQTTIATGFRGKTLLCIAHRLRTIIGYDRICVMDAGTIAELDTPFALWKQGGIFRSMCDRSGIRAEDIHGAREELAGLETGEGSRL